MFFVGVGVVVVGVVGGEVDVKGGSGMVIDVIYNAQCEQLPLTEVYYVCLVL